MEGSNTHCFPPADNGTARVALDQGFCAMDGSGQLEKHLGQGNKHLPFQLSPLHSPSKKNQVGFIKQSLA